MCRVPHNLCIRVLTSSRKYYVSTSGIIYHKQAPILSLDVSFLLVRSVKLYSRFAYSVLARNMDSSKQKRGYLSSDQSRGRGTTGGAKPATKPRHGSL